MRMVKNWFDRLPREDAESTSMEILKKLTGCTDLNNLSSDSAFRRAVGTS